MPMLKLKLEEVRRIADEYGLRPCKVKGEDVVNIRKKPSKRFEDVDWEEFSHVLKKRRLAVYKAENSDFLKIMKEK